MFAVAADLRAAGTLRVDTSAVSAGRIIGDEAGLRRVLTNLAENAGRHALGRVAFGLTERDDAVLLTVDDDGPGIPGPDRHRVLERFVRLDPARDRPAGGSGLGLAIVAQLVAGHAGSVDIAGSPLGGARIVIRFPPAAPG